MAENILRPAFGSHQSERSRDPARNLRRKVLAGSVATLPQALTFPSISLEVTPAEARAVRQRSINLAIGATLRRVEASIWLTFLQQSGIDDQYCQQELVDCRNYETTCLMCLSAAEREEVHLRVRECFMGSDSEQPDSTPPPDPAA